MQTINPIYDNIVIELPQQESEIKSSGGILISKNNGQFKPDRGIVVSCGEGRLSIDGSIVPMRVKKQDEVIFNRFAGTEIACNNKTYLMIKESDVLAIIK